MIILSKSETTSTWAQVHCNFSMCDYIRELTSKLAKKAFKTINNIKVWKPQKRRLKLNLKKFPLDKSFKSTKGSRTSKSTKSSLFPKNFKTVSEKSILKPKKTDEKQNILENLKKKKINTKKINEKLKSLSQPRKYVTEEETKMSYEYPEITNLH